MSTKVCETNNEGKVAVHLKCIHCNKEFKVFVFQDDIEKFNNGEYLQKAFPYLTEEERELFISGTCDSCMSIMMLVSFFSEL